MSKIFKAKMNNEKQEWVLGYFCYSQRTKLPCIQDTKTLNLYHILQNTLCEITHIKDINNNIICENDIIETENGFLLQCVWSEEYHEFLFKNLKGGFDFMVGVVSELSSFTKGEIRIIGNIYDEINSIRKAG